MKLPTYVVTIKKQCKSRKIQKHREQKDYIEKVVLKYLNKLQNEKTEEVPKHETDVISETKP